MDESLIRVDEQTLSKAKQLAGARRCTVEQLLRDLVIEKAVVETQAHQDLVGFLADEQKLAGRIMDDVYSSRSQSRLRQ